jgi:hypothetical protein
MLSSAQFIIGHKAFVDGNKIEQNPFPKKSHSHKEWFQGFEHRGKEKLEPAMCFLTDSDVKITQIEGWHLVYSKVRLWHEERTWNIEHCGGRFKNDKAVWRHIIEQANKKSALHLTVLEYMEAENYYGLNELNMTFVEYVSRAKMDHTCTRCKKVSLPEDTKLMGIYPDYENNSRWYDEVDDNEKKIEGKGWTMRLELKSPFPQMGYVDHSKDVAIMRIADLYCPTCHVEHSKMVSDMMKYI